MELSSSQKNIINTKNKTLLVSASAGSGKTFVVVEKIINSIIKDKQDIDSFLIVTFTNAAASELKERIVKRLGTALQGAIDAGDSKLSMYLSCQINKAWNANISTLHSFCLSVLKDNFYTLGIDPNVVTLDPTKAEIMLNESIQEVIDEEYENITDAFKDMLELMTSEEELVKYMKGIYHFYAKVADKEKFNEDLLQNYTQEGVVDFADTSLGKNILNSVKDALKANEIELKKCIDGLAGYDEFLRHKEILVLLYNKVYELLQISSWDDFCYNIYMPLELPRSPQYRGADIETKEAINSLKDKVKKNIGDYQKIVYAKTEDIVLELRQMLPCIKWIVDCYEKIYKRYYEKKSKKGMVDFEDYELLAYNALCYENVAKRYKDKFTSIYIDEYQDTSFMQEAIISKIARDNNVIMVGDVKQSIYGFRNAAPELFSGKYEAFPSENNVKAEDNNLKIVLAQNFRSRMEVIDSINDIFEKTMSLEFGGARYTDIEKLQYGNLFDNSKPSSLYKTEINIIETDKIEDEEDNTFEASSEESNSSEEKLANIELEGIQVAKRIHELVGNMDIWDMGKSEYRKCMYKDIVILMKNTLNVANIVSDILKKQNIPVFYENKANFYEAEEIKLIVAFLKILNNPLDEISLASVMYSKIGMFTLDDLVNIRFSQKNCELYTALTNIYSGSVKLEDKLLYNKVCDFLNLLDRFKKYNFTYSLSELVIKVYNETKIYDSFLLEEDGATRRLNYEAFLQIVRDFETTQVASLYNLIEYVETLKGTSGSDGPRLLGENEDVVRIMTVHHSKGLEFPIVILMDTARKYNMDSLKARILTDNTLGIGINIINKKYNISYPSVIKQSIKMSLRHKENSENLRNLYVALTRAKEKLIIYGSTKSYEKLYSKLTNQIVDGAIPAIYLEKNNNLLCNILHGVLANKNTPNFEINVINERNIANALNVENTLPTDLNVVQKFCDIVKEYNVTPKCENVKKLKEKCEFKYHGIDSQNVLQKYTATQLGESLVEERQDFEIYLKPKVLDKTESNMSYGTCIHKIIENISFYMSENEIKEVVEKVLKEFDLEKIVSVKNTLKKIQNMQKALCENIIEKNSVIENEYEYVMLDDLSCIPEMKLEVPSLVQGVIDMYVKTGTRHIVVDFKTDKVENEKELIARYMPQVKIYKRGIELGKGVSNVECYIYSLYLEKLIKV